MEGAAENTHHMTDNTLHAVPDLIGREARESDEADFFWGAATRVNLVAHLLGHGSSLSRSGGGEDTYRTGVAGQNMALFIGILHWILVVVMVF